MEKLLQKNYFLHQSAKDGYRSYLQAYASYSLKKIFDINALDLAKVGKAFGFAVPPRVNVTVGGGSGGSGRGNMQKRKRETNEDDLEADNVDADELTVEKDDEAVTDGPRSAPRKKSKQRREEQLGKKMVHREMFRKGRELAQQRSTGVQWSR